MSRLIVLSNRVKMPDNHPMAGGLAVALHEVLTTNPGVWMGWNGNIVDDDVVDNGNRGTANDFTVSCQPITVSSEPQATKTITYMTTALTRSQYQRFYCGFANNVLWSLLHEQTDFISQDPEDFAGYQAVNRLFAEQLKKIIQPDDVIWVHDYHFLSVAYYCRALGIRNRIGFFLHIPFAALPFWQQLEQSATLIEHLAHFDVIGTQSQQDKSNAIAVLKYYLNDQILESTPADELSKNTTMPYRSPIAPFATPAVSLLLNLADCPAHSLSIDAYPIGVDVANIQQEVSRLALDPALPNAATTAADVKMGIKSPNQQIIAVDRIDHSKGLLQRFSAYRRFLRQHPRYQQQLKLCQIACPSRLDLPVYQRLYHKVQQTVDEINQQFSPPYNKADSNSGVNPPWQAISYSESVLNREALMLSFRQSDVGWVNSLKDGMNLVAKEYIAAQDPENPGVLLLSRFAGAAEQMQDAIIIDPRQPQSIVDGLSAALTMPLAERKSRYQALIQGLQDYDLQRWQQDFLDDLYLPVTCD